MASFMLEPASGISLRPLYPVQEMIQDTKYSVSGSPHQIVTNCNHQFLVIKITINKCFEPKLALLDV